MQQNYTPRHKYPLLSIIVPIYNTEKYLRKCVDSILSQDFKDFELWLIDDGSKDASIDIIKEYSEKDSRIKTAFIKGTGPAIPRNYGLKRASGEYILFVDSDDYLTPGALSTLMSLAQKYPEATFIKGNQFVLVGEEEKKSVFAPWREVSANRVLTGDEMVCDVLRTDFTPTNSLIKHDFLKRNNLLFNEKLVLLEDVPFIAEICGKSEKTVYSPSETYVYRLESETSLTRSKRTLPKVLSLAKISGMEKELSSLFSGKAKELMLKRSVEHSITSLFQAASNLTDAEAKEVKKEVRGIYRHIPLRCRSTKHLLGAILYNISPSLAISLFKRL